MAMESVAFAFEFPPMDQGQVDAASPAALLPGELSRCRNYYAMHRGELWLRASPVKWLADDAGVGEAGTGLFEIFDTSGTKVQLKFTVSDIYKWTGSDWESVLGDGVTLSGDANSLWSLIEHYGKVYAANGNKPLVWDFGTDGFREIVFANAPDAAGGVFSFAERLGFYDCTYGTGGGADRHMNYLHMSDTKGADAPTFSENGKYPAFPQRGNRVTGVLEKQNILRVAGYPYGTSNIYFDPRPSGQDFAVSPQDMSIGGTNGANMLDVDDWVLFMSSGGHVRAWDVETGNRRTMRRLTVPINTTLQKTVYKGRNLYSSAIFVEELGQYWILLTEDSTRTATQHNLILALRIPDKAPMLVDAEDQVRPITPAFFFDATSGYNFNFLAIWHDSNGDARPVGVDYSGIVWDLWSAPDDDSPDMNFEATLPLSDYGAPNVRKRMDQAPVVFEMGTDGQATVTMRHTVNLGESTDQAEFTVRQVGVPLGEFEVGVDAIGESGQQQESLRLAGNALRSQLSFSGTGKNRHAISMVGVNAKIRRPPVVTEDGGS